MAKYSVRDSKIHGTGVFAEEDIKKGTKIMQYLGEKISKEEGTKRELEQLKGAKHGAGQVYLFELDENFDIDGDVPYNDARFVNHSCDPNCEVDIKNGEIWYVALRDIKKGEELSIDYGFDLEYFAQYICECGAPNCIGFIVGKEHWDKLPKPSQPLKK